MRGGAAGGGEGRSAAGEFVGGECGGGERRGPVHSPDDMRWKKGDDGAAESAVRG